MDMVFDTWHYHNQIQDLTKLAKSLPDLIIIHDHFGGPLGIGPYINKRDEIFDKWKEDIYELSQCKNVFSKRFFFSFGILQIKWFFFHLDIDKNVFFFNEK